MHYRIIYVFSVILQHPEQIKFRTQDLNKKETLLNTEKQTTYKGIAKEAKKPELLLSSLSFLLGICSKLLVNNKK